MTGRLVVAVVLLVTAGTACAGERTLPADSPPPPSAVDTGAPAGPATGTAPRGRDPGASGTPRADGVGDTRREAARRAFTFPVRGRTSYSRAHHDYPATDVFAACRTPVVAPVRGVVLEVRRRDRYRPGPDRPALRGGRFFSLRGADGVRYYGSHLRALVPGLRGGTRVRGGERLGRVGQSGNARGTGCHLHFGLSPVCAGTGDWRVRRGVVRPYRFLRAWERGRDRSPAKAVRSWRAEHGCPRRAG